MFPRNYFASSFFASSYYPPVSAALGIGAQILALSRYRTFSVGDLERIRDAGTSISASRASDMRASGGDAISSRAGSAAKSNGGSTIRTKRRWQ